MSGAVEFCRGANKQMTMHGIYRLIGVALSVLLVQACATGARVQVDYDSKQNFQTLHSYAWAQTTDDAQRPKARDSLTEERVHSAVDAHLAARGYKKVDTAQADFLVTYAITVEQRTNVNQSQVGVGFGRYGGSSAIGFGYSFPVGSTNEPYAVGSLIIDILDAKQKRLLWRGIGEQTLDAEQSPENRTTRINTTVNEILSSFPPEPGKSK
jgi:hypothetical protein